MPTAEKRRAIVPAPKLPWPDDSDAESEPEPDADKDVPDVPDEGDAGVLDAIPGLRLHKTYKKRGETCTHPTQAEWWTEADGRRRNNVLGLTWDKGKHQWRIKLSRLGTGKGTIGCVSFARACALAVDPNPPAPRRYLGKHAMKAIEIPDCPVYDFADMIPDLMTDMASHLFVYEDCNGGTLLACKGAKLRGEINERVCKKLWMDLDPKHSCKAPEKTRDCNGKKLSDHMAKYDVIAVVADANDTVREIHVEIKLARMTFNTVAQCWELQFQHVKRDLSDEVWLVFEGFDGLHVVVWNGKTGYSTNGVAEATRGGLIVVYGPSGTTNSQMAHDILRNRLYGEFAHPDPKRHMPVIKYTDARYAEIFAHASEGKALYKEVPMASLQTTVRGAIYERAARWVLTELKHTVTDASSGGKRCDGVKRGANQTEFDFWIDDKRGECKGALMYFVDRGGNHKGEWIIMFVGIKSHLHDVLILVFHGPRGLHIWEYGDNNLIGKKIDKDGHPTNQSVWVGAGTNVLCPKEAEEALLKKLAHSDKNTYLACVAFAENDLETFKAALKPHRKPFKYTPTEIGTTRPTLKEYDDDDDDDDELLLRPTLFEHERHAAEAVPKRKREQETTAC